MCSAHPPGGGIEGARIVRPGSCPGPSLQTRLTHLTGARRAPENGHWGTYFDRVEDRDCVLFGQTDTTVRSGIARQIASVHSDRIVEANEIVHRRADKLAAAGYKHVGVRVS